MRLVVRLLGVDLLELELELEGLGSLELEPCIACEDSGDPCAVCGSEPLELE